GGAEGAEGRRGRWGGGGVSERNQGVCRLAAADLPLRGSAWMSKLSFWPSTRVLMPARSTAEICTNTSGPPPSCTMNPKPFWALKNFTVPVAIWPPCKRTKASLPARTIRADHKSGFGVLWEKALAGGNQAGEIANARDIGAGSAICNRSR